MAPLRGGEFILSLEGSQALFEPGPQLQTLLFLICKVRLSLHEVLEVKYSNKVTGILQALMKHYFPLKH